MSARIQRYVRRTKETDIELTLNLDGSLLTQRLGYLDHLIPGPRRARDPVRAIPQELRIGCKGRCPQATLVGGTLNRRGQAAFARLRGPELRPRENPARLGELRRPNNIHADEIDVPVRRGQPPHQQAIDGLSMNGAGPRLATFRHYSLPGYRVVVILAMQNQVILAIG